MRLHLVILKHWDTGFEYHEEQIPFVCDPPRERRTRFSIQIQVFISITLNQIKSYKSLKIAFSRSWCADDVERLKMKGVNSTGPCAFIPILRIRNLSRRAYLTYHGKSGAFLIQIKDPVFRSTFLFSEITMSGMWFMTENDGDRLSRGMRLCPSSHLLGDTNG